MTQLSIQYGHKQIQCGNRIIIKIISEIDNLQIMRYSALFYLISMLIGLQTLHAQSKSTSDQSPVFRAGASTSNITPYLETLLVGAFSPTPAKNIHDELHARSLVIDNGESKLAFVITDLLMVERKVIDTVKQIIHERTGLPLDHILISAVHNHYGPSAEGEERKDWNYYKPLDDYQKFLVQRIADGVQVALNNLEPAQISLGHEGTLYEPVWRNG